MFDVATALVDTHVVDDPDAERAPSVGRVATAELTMQILVNGEWHRRTPDLCETSCGEPVRMVATPMRREVLSERAVHHAPAAKMCRACFTPHELARASKHDADERAEELRQEKQWLDEIKQRSNLRARRTTNRGDR